ncbi:hypothetical protein NC653_015083 [Populus alba x Populus x berolinensis]|uniref:Uncharacterized protein n=1 Tax=Populus alba x Populus x berolinensis TaxID=444605 RepID=A0AAD6QZQ5_9ROSI|nr:hypothetical protein NC653_015083 [Populus alba x Populus x berolinensis]
MTGGKFNLLPDPSPMYLGGGRERLPVQLALSICRSRFPAQVLKPSSVEYVNTHFSSVLTDSCSVF